MPTLKWVAESSGTNSGSMARSANAGRSVRSSLSASSRTARVGFEGTWKGEWQSVPTSRLVLSVLGGAWWLRSGDEDPGITTAPAALDSFLGTTFGSSPAIGGRNPQDRYQLRASTEWYKPGAGGSHNLKVGTDIFKMRAERGSVSRGVLGNYT